MSIEITEKAAAEVKRVIEQENRDELTFLRVGVAGGGCSGFQYALAFDSKYDEANDSKSEQFGITVVVDKKSSMFLEGTKLDFYEGVDKRGFHFENPNAVKTCGCGSSFQA
jgi:iron-sulfur cluster assembly protein